MNFNNLFLVMLLLPAASLMASEVPTDPVAQYAEAEQQQYAAIALQKAAFMALAQEKNALKQEGQTLTDKLSGLQNEKSRLNQTIADLQDINTSHETKIAALEQRLHSQNEELTAQIAQLKTQISQVEAKTKQLSTLIGMIEKLTGLKFPQSESGEYRFEVIEQYFKDIEEFVNQYASLIQGYQSLHTLIKEIVINQDSKPSRLKQLQAMAKSIPLSPAQLAAFNDSFDKLEQTRKKSADVDANLGQLDRVKANLGKRKQPAMSKEQTTIAPAAKIARK